MVMKQSSAQAWEAVCEAMLPDKWHQRFCTATPAGWLSLPGFAPITMAITAIRKAALPWPFIFTRTTCPPG